MDFNQQESIRELWRQFDPTCSKRLNIEQLRYVFLGMGKDISEKDLNACSKGGNTCSIDMLNDYLASMPKSTVNMEDITTSVVILSQYTGGNLKTSELRLLLCTQGERLTNEEASSLVVDCSDGSGYVNAQQFSTLITKQ